MIIELTEREMLGIRTALQIARKNCNKRSIKISEMADRYLEIDEKLKRYQELLRK